MAQNVTVAGASYSDVPSLILPKTGGGSAQFYDVSDTTAAASDVATGKLFYASDGTLTTGTSSGGGGGCTRLVVGNFTVDSGTGAAHSVTIPYTGSGYPITAVVFIAGGAYNNTASGNTTWYNSVQRYAVGLWGMSKAVQDTTPTYSNAVSQNLGVTWGIYKNSTNTAATYSRTSAMNTTVFSSSAASASATQCVKFNSATSMSYFTAASSYGLLAEQDYTYVIVYTA